ncbi:MAG: hypothetical protein QXX94_03935 [Candidatus Bathyarchaeia archaeon]
MLQEKTGNLKLGSIIVLFDREFGTLFFQDFRGYGNLLDDAEWLLERTPQRSWGFMIRPITDGERYILWIGEYGPHVNQIIREDIISDRNASFISKILFDHANRKISEKMVNKRITIEICKKLLKSKIVQDFKYYICPRKRFYESCPHINEIYRVLKEKYSSEEKVHYSLVAEVISEIKPCNDVIICPLLFPPNSFERIINLNEVLKMRKLGEIKIIDQNMVKII